MGINDSGWGLAIQDQRLVVSYYSFLREIAGSTLAARRAGSQQAADAASRRMSGAPANTVSGSGRPGAMWICTMKTASQPTRAPAATVRRVSAITAATTLGPV